MLQQTSMAQMYLQELKKEDKHLAILPSGLTLEVVQEFQACLSNLNCNRLLEMVNEFPPQLFLQTFDKKESRSALHVVVLEGSQTLIHTLLEKLKAQFGGNDLELLEHDFILQEDEYGLSAPIMIALIANKEIISCFEQSFGFRMDFLKAPIHFVDPLLLKMRKGIYLRRHLLYLINQLLPQVTMELL
jgi:hypothetical protein